MKKELLSNELYKLIRPVADGLDMTVVEVQKQFPGPSETKVVITVMKNDGATGIDDLEKFHRSVQSILELVIGRDNLSMEVGTPGLERNIKDAEEFAFFKNRAVRIYSTEKKDWVSGIITDTDEEGVVLDSGEKILFSNVHKAKLDYRWDVPASRR